MSTIPHPWTKPASTNTQQKQEPLGLRSVKILDAMGRGEGLHPADPDQYGPHHFLLLLRYNLLVFRQEIPRHDRKFLCTQALISKRHDYHGPRPWNVVLCCGIPTYLGNGVITRASILNSTAKVSSGSRCILKVLTGSPELTEVNITLDLPGSQQNVQPIRHLWGAGSQMRRHYSVRLIMEVLPSELPISAGLKMEGTGIRGSNMTGRASLSNSILRTGSQVHQRPGRS